MSDDTLRKQLVGTWELLTYIERDVATDEESYPFGERPLGLSLYTHGAYMSAQLQRPDRAPFAQRQVRVVKIDGDVLQLSTDGPQRFNGASQQSASDHEQVRQRASHLQPVEGLRQTPIPTFVNPNSPLI